MWILILTLIAPAAAGGNSIASVSGFQTEQHCIAAGTHWLKNRQNRPNRPNRPDGWAKSSAICVTQK